MATTLDILIKARNEAKAALQETTREVERLGQSASKSTSSANAGFQGLGSTVNLLKGALGALGITMAAGTAIELAKTAAQAKDVEFAFRSLASQAGASADQILKSLREASVGTIAETQLMLAANRAMALGVTADVQKMTDLMEIARFRARAMGLTMGQAFDDIITGIGRASPLILDNLGIIINAEEANRKYAESIGKAASELTEQEKKQGLLNAVLEQGQEQLDQVGELTTSDAELMQKFGVVIEDTKLALGKMIAVPVVGFLSGMEAGQKRVNESFDRFGPVGVDYLRTQNTMKGAGIVLQNQQERELKIIIALAERYKGLAEIYPQLTEDMKELRSEEGKLILTRAEMIERNDELLASIKRLHERQGALFQMMGKQGSQAFEIMRGIPSFLESLRDWEGLIWRLGSQAIPQTVLAFNDWKRQSDSLEASIAGSRQELQNLFDTVLIEGRELTDQEKERAEALRGSIEQMEAQLRLLEQAEPKVGRILTDFGRDMQTISQGMSDIQGQLAGWAQAKFESDMERLAEIMGLTGFNLTTITGILRHELGPELSQEWFDKFITADAQTRIQMMIEVLPLLEENLRAVRQEAGLIAEEWDRGRRASVTLAEDVLPQLRREFGLTAEEMGAAEKKANFLRLALLNIPKEVKTTITTIHRTVTSQSVGGGLPEFAQGGSFLATHPLKILVGEVPEWVHVIPLKWGQKPGLLIEEPGGGPKPPPPPPKYIPPPPPMYIPPKFQEIVPFLPPAGDRGGGDRESRDRSERDLREATQELSEAISIFAGMAQPKLTAVNVSFQTLFGGPSEEQINQIARLLARKINEENRRVVGLPGV